MGEAFGNDVALGTFLQRVVPDHGGGVQPFFDVALLEDFALAVG